MKKFTLVELVIVVAVVALLAAMIHPMLAAAREAAEEVGCRDNLSRMGKAAAQYATDSDGWAVTGYLGRGIGNWFAVFEKNYQVDKKAFQCPAETNYAFNSKQLNYGLNVLTFGETFGNGQKKVPHRVDEISKFGRDAQLIMFIDTPPVCDAYNGKIRNRAGQAAYYESTSPIAPKDSAKAYYPAYVRHADRANVVMFDGHAEPLSYQQLTEERAKYCNPCVKQWRDSNLAIREF